MTAHLNGGLRLVAGPEYDPEYYQDFPLKPRAHRVHPCAGSPLDLRYPQMDAKVRVGMKVSERMKLRDIAR